MIYVVPITRPGHFARDCEARVPAPDPSLLRLATSDFSPLAQLDQFVASTPLSSFNRVVNVVGVQDMQENAVAASESLALVVVYGFLTQLDLDSDDAFSPQCGRCGGPMVRNEDREVIRKIICR